MPISGPGTTRVMRATEATSIPPTRAVVVSIRRVVTAGETALYSAEHYLRQHLALDHRGYRVAPE